MPKTHEERKRRRWARELERAPRRPGESAAAHWIRTRLRGGVLRIGRRIRPALNEVLGRHSKIGTSPYLDDENFEWVPRLEASWEGIRKEAEMLLTARNALPPLHAISPDHSRIDSGDERWKVYFLKGYGIWLDEHCGQCPQTFEAVRRIPGLESAFFSILEAGKRLPKHRGPTRSIFTAHLGLLVPRERERCWIVVGKIRRHWDAGKMLIFDDTYKHKVSNGTDEDRIVLLMHIRRPLRFPASLLGRAVFWAIRWSPFVRDSLRNQREWDRRLGERSG